MSTMSTIERLALAKIGTAQQLRQELMAAGLPSDAIDLAIKATGRTRHLARVEAAIKAAREAAKVVPFEGRDWRKSNAVAWALIVCDAVGVGGALDAEGAGTLRLPCFHDLGKGRKQASDGGAWDAALLAARTRLVCEVGPGGYFALAAAQGRVVVRHIVSHENEDGVTIAPVPAPARWLRSVAIAALRHTYGERGDSPFPMRGDIAEWARAAAHYDRVDELERLGFELVDASDERWMRPNDGIVIALRPEGVVAWSGAPGDEPDDLDIEDSLAAAIERLGGVS